MKTTTGSSDAPVIMGVSPFKTRWQLYQECAHGLKIETEPDARMEIGVLLEPHIVEKVCKDRGWSFEWNGPTAADALGTSRLHPTDPRASARPDAIVTDPARAGQTGVVECKTINIFRWWDLAGRDDPQPLLYWELQWQWQAYVTGATFGALVVYVVGDDDYLVYPREPDPEVIAAMLEESALFWQQVEQKNEPDPFGDPKELPLIALKYPEVQDVQPQDLGTNEDAAQIFADYQLCQRKSGFYKKSADSLKAQLLGITADYKTTFVSANDGRKFRVNVSKSERAATVITLPQPQKEILYELAKAADPSTAAALESVAAWGEQTRKASVSTRVTVKELETGEQAPAPAASEMDAG